MLGTDKYAYKSKIKNADPLQKLLVSFFAMLVCIFLNKWQISLFTCIIMVFVNMHLGKHTLSEIGHMFKIPINFILIGTLTVIVGRYSSAEDLIFFIKIGKSFYGSSLSSLENGLNIILKSLGVISVVYFFVMNTSIADFSIAMRRLKVPVVFTELMELIYRFIFILLDTKDRISIAQDSRLGYKDLRTSYHSVGDLAARIFIDTLKRSDRIYNALESRGYQGSFDTIGVEYDENSEIVGFGIVVIGLQILLFIMLRFLWKM